VPPDSSSKSSAPIAELLQLWRGTQPRGRGPLPPDQLSAAELGRVAPVLRALSSGFNDRRLLGEGYMGEAEKLAAYLLYFWPISYTQATTILGWTGLTGRRALDLGSGPGPVARALLDHGFQELWAADHRAESLKLAARLNPGSRYHGLPWKGEGEALPACPEVELITLGHVLNELWKEREDRVERRASLLERLCSKLSPGGRILVMEPASHAVNRELLQLRDLLLTRGFVVDAPCFFRGPCPALAADAACHAERPWLAPPLVRQLAQAARIDKSSLAFGWLLLRPPGSVATAPDRRLRVVSEKMVNKAGRERVIVCGAEGRFSLSFPVEDRNRMPWRDPWTRLHRGLALEVEGAVPRESGLGITEKTMLKLV
jgi:SAM-dependent methyltransferase